MEFWCIDRFEEGFALCEGEDGKQLSIPKAQLPEQCQEGDCIYFDESGKTFIDEEETNRRRNKAKELLMRLKRK